LRNIFTNLLENALPYSQINDPDTAKDVKDTQARLYTAIGLALQGFSYMCSNGAVLDSPYTTIITSKDKDRKSENFFEPHEWLVDVRGRVFETILACWKSKQILTLPPPIIKQLLKAMNIIMKGDGEAPHRSETLGALGNIPSLFSAIRTPPVAPDAQGIQTLVEMGFAREAAETAMIRCSNQVPRAIDYLFSHPQLPMTSRGESSRAAATTSEEAEAEESENNEGGSNITGEQASSADAQAIANESLDPNSTGNTDTNVDSTSAMAVDVQLENNGQATDAQTTDSTMQVVEDKPDEAEQSERHNADSAIDEVTQQRERLKELRDDSWKLCAQLTPMILDVAGNLVFEVRDLLLIMAKTYGKEVFAALLEEIEEIRKGLSSAQEDKRLSTRTRLLAILLQDPNAHSQLVEMSQEILPALRSMISAVSDGAEDEEIPSWLAPILLVIEAFLAEKDQPVAEDLITESDQFENPNVSKDAVARQGAKEDPEHEAFIFDMLNCCQKLLTRRKCTRDQLHAILRMLVRLTRSFTIAKEFFTNGGLNLLLAGARSEEPGFQGQQAFIIILMRHMIERSAVLRKTMEKEISAWFTHPRPRLVDVNTYIRNNAYIALRNPEKFVAATKDMCKLSHYDTTGSRPQQITLVKNEKASTSSDSTAGEESTSRAETVESSSSTEDVELTTTVLHCIIGELLDHRLSDADVARFIADLKASEKERADTTTPSANDAKESDPSSKQVTEAKNALSNNVIYTNFLLQCLVELLTSYPSCKTEIISFNRKGSNTSQVKSKYVFLNYLLNDLLPYGGVTPNEELVRKKFGLSNWAASVLVAICSAADDEKDMTDDSDMTSGRKQVLESIIRAIKDASNSTEGINARYGKLFALGDLCHRLLNARQNSPTVQRIKTTDEMSSRIAKLMLEKHFVSVLTNALSEIDVNYPHARTVINALLRPLEQLTKVAIRLARPTDTNKEERRRESRLQQVYGDSDDIESDAEDAPDLYRNSALGMYEGNLEQENDAMDTSEEEEIYEEDDYADETGSDLSDLSDEEGIEEGDIDEEIDVIMHPHDYHDEDEDDEDEDGSDQDDEDEDEEDLLEDTGVIEDEDGSDDDQEMTWEIADMDEEDDDDDNNDLVPLSVDIGDDLVSMSPALHHHFDDGDGHVEMIIEDAEDEDDGESDTDDANEIDEHDGDDADDYEDDVLDDRRSLPFNFDGNLGDEGWVLGNRSFVNLGGRRHARIMPSRHTMFEITSPSGNFDFIGDGADETRFSSLLEDADNLDTLSSRFGRPNISTSDDVTTHPLLAGQDGPSENASMQNRARGIPSASGDVRTLEDLIGGSAIQLLESILSRHSRPSRAGNHATGYRLELNTANGGVLGSVDIPSLLAARRPGATASTARNRSADMKDPLATIQEFSPMTTAERWHQEARMLFGTNMADKAFKLSNAILNALAPAAIAEEKRRKEQEEKARAERKAKEEEERRKQEEEAKRRRQEEEEAAAKKAEEDAAMTSEEQQGVPETSEGHGEGSQSRQANNPDMTVMVNGVPIDLTGSGIDPTFLEALPEDLRQEVISQHVRERTSQPSTNDDANISPEFLEALPPDIRQEVLQQEAMERERRNRQSRNETADSLGPSDLDPASFLATLDPMLRETVLMEQDDSFLVTLPPALVAEANSIRDRPSHRVQIGRPRPSHALQSNTSSTAKKANPNKDSVQLLDRPQLASLLRLLFLPQAISKTMLNKLLLNLSENSKTRADLIALLLSVLQDGSVDLAAVDKNFAQMSLRPKPSLKAHSKGKMSSGSNLQVSAMSENVPNLITQRCIEALTYIVTYNEQAVQFFLSEHENLSGLKRNITKKGKGKDRGPSSSKYAVVVLLSLLDRPVFLQNTHIMDQLMHLIATVCRPLSSLNKTEAVNGKANSKPNDATDNETPAPAPAPGDDGVQDEAKAEDGNNQGKSTEQNTKETASESTPNPPNIPEHYLRLVVDVLTAGECSSKTFQYTLTVIQHLCALPEAKNVITNALRKSAQDLGNAILIDLKELAPMIESATSGADLQGSTLSRFSQSSSQQAKLLRVLKTLDYIYSRKQQATQPTASPAEPVEPAEPAERAALTPGAITTGEEKPTTYVLTEDERNVLKIYDSLSFQPLWKMLGYSLGLVHDKRDMIHVATVLLPLIESFMVVSRYVGINGAQSKEKGKEKYDAEDSTTDTTSDDLFFTFTEEHRKILNTMVRNNPSLMSGSFSLLVRNPKMLEFDNKRNYFVQQLHKRVNNREHYGSLQLNVRRQYVFEDSYHQLQGRTGDEIKYGKLNVHFYDEEGVDAGGVTREWFSVLARQMFDPNYALFKTSAADKLTYQPNRASWVNPDHLSFFKFVGRVIGKAIYDGKLLDAYFTRSFYKHILGRPVDYRDIEAIDPAYFKSLDWMLENSIQDVMELTFSMETDDFGTQKTIDLKPNGRNIEVTDENKHEYVRLVTEQKLTVAIKDQIRAFLEGFHDVIPPHLISIFNEQELELLISGLPDIDIDDWKNNTEYQGYTASSPQVQWFWRAVRSFDQEERAKLLQFATGTSKVPLEGFNRLQGSSGVQKFQIHKDYSSNNRLPSAHTCYICSGCRNVIRNEAVMTGESVYHTECFKCTECGETVKDLIFTPYSKLRNVPDHPLDLVISSDSEKVRKPPSLALHRTLKQQVIFAIGHSINSHVPSPRLGRDHFNVREAILLIHPRLPPNVHPPGFYPIKSPRSLIGTSGDMDGSVTSLVVPDEPSQPEISFIEQTTLTSIPPPPPPKKHPSINTILFDDLRAKLGPLSSGHSSAASLSDPRPEGLRDLKLLSTSASSTSESATATQPSTPTPGYVDHGDVTEIDAADAHEDVTSETPLDSTHNDHQKSSSSLLSFSFEQDSEDIANLTKLLGAKIASVEGKEVKRHSQQSHASNGNRGDRSTFGGSERNSLVSVGRLLRKAGRTSGHTDEGDLAAAYHILASENTAIKRELDATKVKLESTEAELAALKEELQQLKERQLLDIREKEAANLPYTVSELRRLRKVLGDEVDLLATTMDQPSEQALSLATEALRKELESLRSDRAHFQGELDLLLEREEEAKSDLTRLTIRNTELMNTNLELEQLSSTLHKSLQITNNSSPHIFADDHAAAKLTDQTTTLQVNNEHVYAQSGSSSPRLFNIKRTRTPGVFSKLSNGVTGASHMIPSKLAMPNAWSPSSSVSGHQPKFSTHSNDSQSSLALSPPRTRKRSYQWGISSSRKDAHDGLGIAGLSVNSASSSPQSPAQVHNLMANHQFVQAKVLRPTRCDVCHEKMFGFNELRCQGCSVQAHGKCVSGVPNCCLSFMGMQSGAPSQVGMMFGNELTKQYEAEGNQIPLVIRRCVEVVELRGMTSEGIYRKSGSLSQTRQIQMAFEQGQNPDLEDEDEYNDIAAITSVLKQYLRELPEPVISFNVYEDLLKVVRDGDQEAVISVLSRLPYAHFETCKFIIAHLHRVQQGAQENLMTTRNLAVVFGPTLLRSPDPTADLLDMGGKNAVVEYLVSHGADLLLDTREPREQESMEPSVTVEEVQAEEEL
ncbi:hypothetical protein BZG36_05295, partial [Bifiguratus adelaidae]